MIMLSILEESCKFGGSEDHLKKKVSVNTQSL